MTEGALFSAVSVCDFCDHIQDQLVFPDDRRLVSHGNDTYVDNQ